MDKESFGEGVHASVENKLEDKVGVDDLANTPLFDAMEEEREMGVGGTEIWSLDRQPEDLLDVNERSIFYNDFPPLPDFPCMSSSSSSSSSPAKANTMTSSASSSASSSSVASWAVLRSETERQGERKNHHDQVGATPTALSSTASMEVIPPTDVIGNVDCMGVVDNFEYMDLIDGDDAWDPSTFLQTDNPQEFTQEESTQQYQTENNEQFVIQSNNGLNGGVAEKDGGGRPSEELAVVFLEWLKSNKEYISAEDMRSIKIRRSTIECASKRLGTSKEGQKQLLKLILEWVEQYQLNKKKNGEPTTPFPYQYEEPFPNPSLSPTSNPNLTCNSVPPDPNACLSPSPWMPPPQTPYIADPATVVTTPQVFPMVGYMGDPYSNNGTTSQLNQTANVHPFPASTEYQIMDSAQPWPPTQIAMASPYNPYQEIDNLSPAQLHPQAVTGYGNQYPYPYNYQGSGEKLVKLGPSATKEARKKRMARQKRIFAHHRHHNHQNNPNPPQTQNQSADQHARVGSTHDNCTNTTVQANQGNWVYWPQVADTSASTGGAMMPPVDVPSQPYPVDQPPMQVQNYQRQAMVDRRQGWKPEKNLKFLLQKVLKQSDVGNLGRIVLPKKEAETHLPELEARDGITIPMEDIGTSCVWNMRYRFWPNNKSRMYLLENTGDFVRANGLQEGDFIVIYSDVKCGKYLIRGVKVRQPGQKSEGRKSGKGHKNLRTANPALGTVSIHELAWFQISAIIGTYAEFGNDKNLSPSLSQYAFV
ncbi:B3 domain-containing transcription factor ABI3 [Cornus florida]|uniref:B3 domain-containing transcription factor ABI3 n=1 Tax=Cornus florida TaxID=4283 RepID=UPI0028A14CAC|nr:B3 domain-containing transcription factor ABI3 [Cornus florida]